MRTFLFMDRERVKFQRIFNSKFIHRGSEKIDRIDVISLFFSRLRKIIII